jgi:hypothetical protein
MQDGPPQGHPARHGTALFSQAAAPFREAPASGPRLPPRPFAQADPAAAFGQELSVFDREFAAHLSLLH